MFFGVSKPAAFTEKEVIILDVTRMQEDRVCIAGICRDPEQGYVNIRPIPPYGNLHEPFLFRDGKQAIEPFTVLRFKITGAKQNPPHIEDHVFMDRDPAGMIIIGTVPEPDRMRILESISRPRLAEIFGGGLEENRFLCEGSDGGSLGCLNLLRPPTLSLSQKAGKLSMRFGFYCESAWVSLPIVELRLNLLFHRLIESGKAPESIKKSFWSSTRGIRNCYLRLGLTRPWHKPDDSDERKKCYVQVLGLHTFPDYWSRFVEAL